MCEHGGVGLPHPPAFLCSHRLRRGRQVQGLTSIGHLQQYVVHAVDIPVSGLEQMENKDQTIRSLADFKRELMEKREKLLRPLQQLDKDLDAVTGAITAMQRFAHMPEPAPALEFPITQLRGLTQVQALVAIAKHNDGIIRAQEAKRMLIKAGVMRETKNSTNIIHAVILRSEKFERVRPGEYRLKEAQAKPKEEGLFRAPVQ